MHFLSQASIKIDVDVKKEFQLTIKYSRMSKSDFCWATLFIPLWCRCRMSNKETETRWTSEIQTWSRWTTTWILAER